MNKREYLNHFSVLFSGTAAAQLINLFSYPFLARLYSPAEFGTFALFIAISALPAALACGRFDLAIPIAPKHARSSIFWLCILVSIAVGTASAIGGGVYQLVFGVWSDSLLPVLLGLCVGLTGLCLAATLHLLRHDHYRASSSSIVVRTAATVLTQIALAFVEPDSRSLIIGFVLGIAAQAVMLSLIIARQASPGPPRMDRMRAMARRFKRQVMVDIPSTSVAVLSLNLLTFCLSTLYGQAVVGLYSLGHRIAVMPIQLFNDALSQVFFQKAAQAQRDRGQFWSEMRFTLILSAMLGVGTVVAIWLFARPFVIAYLGQGWEPAATMLIILAPMVALRSVTGVIQTAAFILQRTRWLLVHNVANVVAIAAAFGAAAMLQLGAMEFLALAAFLMSLEYFVFALFLIVAARRGHAGI